MILDGEGNPYVIWTNEMNKSLYVKHWKALENRWRYVGPNPISNVSGKLQLNIPQIDWKNNNLVNSWERPRIIIGIIYKRWDILVNVIFPKNLFYFSLDDFTHHIA